MTLFFSPEFVFSASDSRFLYPGMIAILISTLTFPPGLGQFFAGQVYHFAFVLFTISNNFYLVIWETLKLYKKEKA